MAAPAAGLHPFVEAHAPTADDLGIRLADAYHDPERFAAMLSAGLASLADPAYRAGQRRTAPGIGPTYGVRTPLLARVVRAFAQETRQDRPAALLYLAERVYREDHLEPRWFAFALLERTLDVEPERTWQLLRRGAREAGDWITVDTLARPYAAGVTAESYRWAELEQLVYSPSRWERRLVGSTIATLSHLVRDADARQDVLDRSLALLALLIGDDSPDVQKALSWAYRSIAAIDRSTVERALLEEATRAAEHGDGHRAGVVRDSLDKLDPDVAARLRVIIEGVRRRPGAPSTSSAAEVVARFGRLPDPSVHPEPPLT